MTVDKSQEIEQAMLVLRIALLEDALASARRSLAGAKRYARALEPRLFRAEWRKKQMHAAFTEKLSRYKLDAWRGRIALSAAKAAYARRKEDAKRIADLEVENAHLLAELRTLRKGMLAWALDDDGGGGGKGADEPATAGSVLGEGVPSRV